MTMLLHVSASFQKERWCCESQPDSKSSFPLGHPSRELWEPTESVANVCLQALSICDLVSLWTGLKQKNMFSIRITSKWVPFFLGYHQFSVKKKVPKRGQVVARYTQPHLRQLVPLRQAKKSSSVRKYLHIPYRYLNLNIDISYI